MENRARFVTPARIKSPTRILAVSLALGCIADYFFYGKAIGIALPLFVMLTLGALFGLGKMEGVKTRQRNLWFAVPLLFFAAMTAVRADPLLTALNICATLALMVYLAYFYAAGHFTSMGFLGHAEVIVLTAMATMTRAAPLIGTSVSAGGIRRVGIHRLLPVARGLILAIPVLFIFMALFTSADLIFAQYISGLFRLEYLGNVQDLFWQLAIVLGVGWLLAGGLAFALGREEARRTERLSDESRSLLRQAFSVGSTEVTTLMVCVISLFFAFCWIQFTYLFGGATNISVAGHTYADYARRGFFELVVASVLAGVLILGLRWLGARDTRRDQATFSVLRTLLVSLVMVLLASAFWRMILYEDAYGYTHLRLYVHLFEIWLAVTLLWLPVTLWAPRARFGIGAFVAALGFLVTLNLVNPDAFIATQNIERWRATGKVDAPFLAQLSDDAVPPLLAAIDVVDVAGPQGYERAILRLALLKRLQQLEEARQRSDWTQFHFAHDSAYRVLVTNRSLLER